MPGQIVAKVFAGDAGFAKPRAQFLEATARARQALRVAKDADVVPHEVVERLANRLDVARSLADRTARARFRRREIPGCGLAPLAVAQGPLRHRVPRDRAEHGRIGDPVPAEAIGAVHAARVFASREQALERGAPVGRELDAAHHVVRGGNDFDEPAGEVEAAIGAALDHALELRAHVGLSQVRHRDVEPAVG